MGAPPKLLLTTAVLTAAHIWVLRQDTFEPLPKSTLSVPRPSWSPRCLLELLQDCLREPNSITRRLQEGPRRVLKVFIFEPCSTQARSVYFGGPLGAPGSPLELLQDCLRAPNGAPRRLQDGQALDASFASWVLACLRAPRPRMPGALPGRMISLGPRVQRYNTSGLWYDIAGAWATTISHQSLMSMRTIMSIIMMMLLMTMMMRRFHNAFSST